MAEPQKGCISIWESVFRKAWWGICTSLTNRHCKMKCYSSTEEEQNEEETPVNRSETSNEYNQKDKEIIKQEESKLSISDTIGEQSQDDTDGDEARGQTQYILTLHTNDRILCKMLNSK